ncbi:M43 family zinc metalloprotease [Larkinella insperata]|uniref:M43 family zinc metalloprotease n=1 Tax=Larkinella insperata TaxID=332158 RepID=A0ABW3QKR4_9BACT
MKNRNLVLFTCTLFFFLSETDSYCQKLCGTPEIEHILINTNRAFRRSRGRIENFQKVFNKESSERFNESVNRNVITIPVVVHVVYKNDDEKISLSRIQEQIDILNEDFRARNSDAQFTPDNFKNIIGDAGIEFRLAIRSPNNEVTNGVTYTLTNEPKFFLKSNNVKYSADGGRDAWDPQNYLNIWVCDLDQYIGYATPPGLGINKTDGVVIRYTAFGKTGATQKGCELGRTATHEIGHWLDLAHIWGDCNGQDECCSSCLDDDGVDDTPIQNRCNQGPIDFNSNVQSCNGVSSLFVNYMDYVDDRTMVMFSKGQGVRMWGTLQFARKQILNSKALIPVFSDKLLKKAL